jgi:hypothetical protein
VRWYHRARMAWVRRHFPGVSTWTLDTAFGGWRVRADANGQAYGRVFYGPNAERKAARDRRRRA